MLAVYIFTLMALIAAGLFFIRVPPENKEMLNTLIQSVLMLAVAAGGFFWGSSVGSRMKDSVKMASPTPDPEVKP
jgi:hypothetical protein